MSSSPFAPPPTETPTVVPPNRVPRATGLRTLITWIVLILVLVAVYNIFASGPPRHQTRPPPVTATFVWGWLVPLATYGGMIITLILIRSRLPAKYRTGELREISAKKDESPAPSEPPPPIEITLSGTDGARPIELRLDDQGIHWLAGKRLVAPAAELHVAWNDLESVSMGRLAAPTVTWGFMTALFGVAMAWVQPILSGVLIVLGAALAFFGRSRGRGTMTFATATHVLTFQARGLETGEQDRIMAAVRARKPSAVVPAAKPGHGAFWALVIEPFAQLGRAGRPYAWLRALMLREGATYVDEETALASTLQYRLFSVWSGVLRGAGPLSVAVGAGLVYSSVSLLIMSGFMAWMMGLILVARSTVMFARFSGMSVVR